MNWPKNGKIFTVSSGPASQSIGRGRISREGALDVRESRERRDKIVPIFSTPAKQETRAILACCFFSFFEQDRLLFARVNIRVTEFPTKTAENEEQKNGFEIFFFKSGRAHPVFNGKFSFFWPQKN